MSLTFLWNNILWFLLVLPVLVAVYFLVLKRRHRYAVRYSSLNLIKTTSGKYKIRRHIPSALFLLCLGVTIVTLARPVFSYTPTSQQGTIILAIDCSDSMRSYDIKPTRLNAAKAAATEFVDVQPADVRIGVVSFSTTSALVQAPTTNHKAVIDAINRLDVQARTAIGSGILTALDAIFEKPGQPAAPISSGLSDFEIPPAAQLSDYSENATSIIILLSDGQSNEGPKPDYAVLQAERRGVRIYTVGMGTNNWQAGGLVSGVLTQMDLDSKTLEAIAEETNAKYYAAENATQLYDVYQRLGAMLVFPKQEIELTPMFNVAVAALALLAGALSLLWFIRIPW